MDHDIIQSLQTDSLAREELQSIFAVYRQSEKEGLIGLEKPYPGKYQITSDKLIYVPDSAFAKGQTYRAEFRMPEFYDHKDVVTGRNLPGKVNIQSAEFVF